MLKARITGRITRKNFCGMAGSTEYFTVDDPRIGMVPVADVHRSVQIGDSLSFAYVAVGSGYRWMPQ